MLMDIYEEIFSFVLKSLPHICRTFETAQMRLWSLYETHRNSKDPLRTKGLNGHTQFLQASPSLKIKIIHPWVWNFIQYILKIKILSMYLHPRAITSEKCTWRMSWILIGWNYRNKPWGSERKELQPLRTPLRSQAAPPPQPTHRIITTIPKDECQGCITIISVQSV